MKKFEKVNQSNIFLYHIIKKLIFLQIHNILENPQISNMNSDFVPASTVSRRRYSIGLLKKYEKEPLKNLLILFRCAKRSILPDKTTLLENELARLQSRLHSAKSQNSSL